jgi:hypothetical protein
MIQLHEMESGPYQELRWSKRTFGLVHSQISLLWKYLVHHRRYRLHPCNYVEL